MVEETVFQGGVNTVRRRGDRVHRPATAAAPAIHRLLRHLRAAGFDAAPEPFGHDDEGNEVLSYLEGDVHNALPAELRTPELLTSAAALLRRLHDASATFAPAPDDRWQLPARSPVEVVCHGDLAPYNCVVRAGRVVGFIDFDNAHPGPRVWDLAYAVYRFAPLHAPTNPDSAGSPEEQARRAAAFCRAYGVAPGAELLDTVVDRLAALLATMRQRAEAGEAASQAHIAAGHPALYEEDMRYLRSQRERLLQGFAAPRAGSSP
ncbi:aminoglycoside phosphotransferase [Sorangium cellulosum]|uniref:Aminoglycoside phosphotransferase n=2 Tax=Sorangium cellulosum TaxID=56 RepID=A0A150PVF3_SORCE|nr:aminoglycoside phosphotransferase family protein [Sorangium cellulosum]AGP38367.1 aminoglycoside phosphotransferase [Sorangium cellulosum So0157-2]KYF59670.1 aminoglycoside phosphotransferase [Sorangium cellulosum]